MVNPTIKPEKNTINIDIFFSLLIFKYEKSMWKKFNDVKKIITIAIAIDMKLISTFKISFPPIIRPKNKNKNIGRNLRLPTPFFTFIWRKLVKITGKHNNIIAFVGGIIKAIIGTENIDIPIPTEPFTMPPKKTANIITDKFSNIK